MVRLWALVLSLLVMAVVALNAAVPAGAQQWSTPDPGFRVEWEPGTTKKGAPVVRGYIRNDTGFNANQVKLLIEGLDSGGAVASTQVGYLAGMVPAFNRLYFEVPVKAAASSYRVRVASYEPVNRGGP